jgi:NAD-dependent SIR2 family protein deacetylase
MYTYTLHYKQVCNHPEGIIKPDIVFFGENLGNKFAELLDVDRHKCDLVIVIGSSLQVRESSVIRHRWYALISHHHCAAEPLVAATASF